MRFTGRVAIVTGGGAGIGRATCLALAREGAAVAVVEWDRTLAVDLKAHFLACRAVVPHMRRRGRGHIVNVASIAGRHVSLANSIPYTSAKAGVIGFTRHLAQEVGPDGIRVNAVAPGPVKTELLYSAVARGSEREAQFQARIPLRYVSEAEEQAAVILFLASDAASFVHGAIVDVNGGLL